jgi:Protein of unknown function (DUF3606)
MATSRSPDLLDAPAGPGWAQHILPVICRFLELPDNWDSYGGRALRPETGMFALSILNKVMDSQTPVPHAVPLGAGGVQFEWHENDLDLELTIAGPNDFELWYKDHRTGASDNIMLSDDLSALIGHMARLKRSNQLPDPKSGRAPQDRSRISLGEDYEVRYWSKRFGVTADKLKAAVKKVGNSAEAVEKELKVT